MTVYMRLIKLRQLLAKMFFLCNKNFPLYGKKCSLHLTHGAT